jgi:AcrR family transcriptional regulator
MAVAPPTRPALRERYNRRQSEIVDTAARLFARKGYHATSMTDLIEATGLASGGLYHYIGSKEQLLLRICDQLMDPLLDEADAIVAGPQPATERLRAVVRAWMRHVERHRAHMLVFQQERRVLEADERWQDVRRQRKRFERLVDQLLRESEDEGAVTLPDRQAALLALLGMVNYAPQWFRADGRLSAEQIADRWCDLLLGERDDGEPAGEVGMTIGLAGGQAETSGTLTTGSAWSTIKVPIALAVLRDAGGPSGLDAGQSDSIRQALTISDNAAASRLFEALADRHGGVPDAAAAVTEILRAAGDGSTTVSTRGRDGFSPYGQTDWPLAAQQRFMSGLVAGRAADATSTSYVLDLMGRVTSDTWGLGSIGLAARWKGGWGPGTDGRYLARQMGVVDHAGTKVIVCIAACADDGRFESAQALATQLARRALGHVGRDGFEPSTDGL